MRVKITNWKKISASVLIISAVFVLLSLQTKAASQSDAIAVRVMPNTNHDSIETWYAKQGFVGSPQSLIVDGYEAIRDGRTVFVNAANIDSSAWYKPTSESGTPAGRECKVRLAVNQSTGAVNCSLDLIGNPNTYAEEFLGTISYGAYATPYCATAKCPVMLDPNKCRWALGARAWSNQCSVRTNSTKLYTNIYLISYNQESEEKTLDILGQLVSHWKFNNNISDSGRCSISKLNCQADTDCPTNYICANANNSEASNPASFGKCILSTSQTCLIDSDCPVNLFCDSLKSRSIRDINRLGKFNQITDAIETFKAANGKYPSLQSGTYVLGNSMSVWPSWKETLWPQLGLNQLLVDPINILGFCEGYDAATCWNNKINTFVNSNLALPGGSYAFVYKAAANGINYALCSVFETKDLGYDTLDKKISSNSCSVNTTYGGYASNTAPYVVSSYTSGEAGKEFNGYIKVKDDEGDLISWNLGVGSPISWASNGWQLGTSLVPVLQDTGDPSQKKIYAPKTGNSGFYDMNLTLTDSRGGSTTTKLTIVVSAAGKPKIEAEDVTYFIDPVSPLKYTFSVEGSNSKPTYSITPNSLFTTFFNQSLKSSNITSVGLNKNKIDLSFLISTSTKITKDIIIPVKITATADGMSSTKDVNFNLKMERPYLDFTCENMARMNQYYPIAGSPCILGKQKSGNHTLTYSVFGPGGLSLNYVNSDYVSLKADSLEAVAATSSTIKVTVVNEYGASAEKSFDLKINTFCGDDIKQKPNTEGRGGLLNDGAEECDGVDGVWTETSTVSMQPSKQYACTSGWNIKSPYPILDNNSCIFKSATEGGGYCGDGYCQNRIIDVDGVSQEMETCSNCSQDCGVCVCTPNCGTNVCGSDGCGGSCGDCGITDVCTNGSCCPVQANIQVCADDAHKTYFNGTLVGQGNDWRNVEKFNTTILAGKNVMAINGIDLGVVWGFSATLNQGACRSMTTDDLSNWKCINTEAIGISLANWNTINYDDSGWEDAYVTGTKGNRDGNRLPYQQIWSPDANAANTSVYCRYTFSTSDKFNSSCTPNCTGKCGGSDGCGGLCLDTCISPETCGGSGVQYVCGKTENFVCTPNCARKCGGSDGCGDLCPSTCGEDEICPAPKYMFCKPFLK